MPRANSSLPVPVSPTSKTVTLRLAATWVASAIESRIAELSPITWDSQRSADAACDRAEIVTPFLYRVDGEPPRREFELPGQFGALLAMRELCLADEEKGPQVTHFKGVRAPGKAPEQLGGCGGP